MLLPVQIFALALAVSEPEVGELQLYQDWVVGCDNLRSCHAVSLPTAADGDVGPLGDGNVTVAIKRNIAASDAPIIQLAVVDEIPGSAMSDIKGVSVDDGKILLELSNAYGVYDLNAKASLRVLNAMKEADEIVLVDGKGKSVARASLKGLIAALAYMDDRQYRRDTVSALVNPGRKPTDYAGIPLTTPARQVRIAAPSQIAATVLNSEIIAQLRKQDPCLERQPDKTADEPEYHRLDERSTLLILPTTCGGYNPYRQLYVIGNDGTVAKPIVSLRKSTEHIDGTDLPDVGWDSKRQRLVSFGRGRVLADCGEILEFAWSEGRFTLTHHSSMTPCRGSRDYITTYRLKTVIEVVR